MLLMVLSHACSGPEYYAGHERIVVSKIEPSTIIRNVQAAGTDVVHEINDVLGALAAISFHESAGTNDPQLIGDKNLDYADNPANIGPALGKYQMMTKYWPDWAKLAGVEDKYVDPKGWIDRDEKGKPAKFMIPEDIQDKVARAHFEERLKAKGNDLNAAISEWNPNDHEYLQKVLSKAPVKKDGAK
jgi:hypothetical protein